MKYHKPYKVVNHQSRPKKFVGLYCMPDEAMWLIGDIEILEIMQTLLDRLQERSFVERGDAHYQQRVTEARKVMRRLAFLIGLLHQIAEKNLAYDYLAGEKIPRRSNRQTIADVLNLLMEGFKP